MAHVSEAPSPILASWKISKVLDQYPRLLDTLVELSPAFSRLRNPVARRIHARLATVGHAARMAGLDQTEMLRALNRAAGLPMPEALADDAGARPEAEVADAWPDEIVIAEELDVRELQRSGQEPFSAIMAAVSRVAVGQALRLRSTFEPVPLYDVLAWRGFRPRARQLGPDDWEVLLLRFEAQAKRATGDEGTRSHGSPEQTAAPSPNAPATVGAPAEHGDAAGTVQPSATISIDVSDLVPPEPMVRILSALEQLGPGQTLLVHHVRRPIHLYPRLEALGCSHTTTELGPGQIQLLITKPGA